jgi:hypothetical protein
MFGAFAFRYPHRRLARRASPSAPDATSFGGGSVTAFAAAKLAC